jgi:hypothetical protein
MVNIKNLLLKGVSLLSVFSFFKSEGQIANMDLISGMKPLEKEKMLLC